MHVQIRITRVATQRHTRRRIHHFRHLHAHTDQTVFFGLPRRAIRAGGMLRMNSAICFGIATIIAASIASATLTGLPNIVDNVVVRYPRLRLERGKRRRQWQLHGSAL